MTLPEPDVRWAELGRLACGTLAPLFAAIEHVGSTAVPGLPARPEIDLLAAAADLDEIDEAALATLGYRNRLEREPDELRYRREDYDSTAYLLHIVPASTWADRPERLLRDLLRADPAARERYATRKKELMARFGPGQAYTDGKTVLIAALTTSARAGRDLPPSPVRGE
ncbi:GrpB family protein [Actinoplanes sp. NPDC051859]|uniref:GrpB family protein n=1 Tax=Actinoplanes sp. NPDC051859 TaxID=3363909 RepID=UPI0037B49B28